MKHSNLSPFPERVVGQLYNWLGERGCVVRWEEDKSPHPKTDVQWRCELAKTLHGWLTSQGKVVARGADGSPVPSTHFSCGPIDRHPRLLWQHMSAEDVCRTLGTEELLIDLMLHHCLHSD